jgi:hypothetical protein
MANIRVLAEECLAPLALAQTVYSTCVPVGTVLAKEEDSL